MNYLLDLERSIKTGMMVYWGPNKMGYTGSLYEAGKYSDQDAKHIVDDDLDNRTVIINEKVVKNIMRDDQFSMK